MNGPNNNEQPEKVFFVKFVIVGLIRKIFLIVTFME